MGESTASSEQTREGRAGRQAGSRPGLSARGRGGEGRGPGEPRSAARGEVRGGPGWPSEGARPAASLSALPAARLRGPAGNPSTVEEARSPPVDGSQERITAQPEEEAEAAVAAAATAASLSAALGVAGRGRGAAGRRT